MPITEDQLRKVLKQKVKEAGSARKLAHEFGVSNTNITDTLNGRLGVSVKMAARLGYRRLEPMFEELKGRGRA